MRGIFALLTFATLAACAKQDAPSPQQTLDAASAIDPIDEERALEISLDSAGIKVNGALVVPPDALGSSLHKIAPLAEALRVLREHRRAAQPDNPDRPGPTVTIAESTDALVAASTLMTLSGDGNSTMTVRVGTTTFRATYLGRLSRMIPTERYLFLSPRATSGYTLERHFVARDVAKRGPPCLTRFASQAIGADAEIARAAAKVCAPFEPDCADHVVVELATTGRNFDDVARVLAAALRVPSLALRQWRFVEAGQASYPDAVTCAPDAGAK